MEHLYKPDKENTFYFFIFSSALFSGHWATSTLEQSRYRERIVVSSFIKTGPDWPLHSRERARGREREREGEEGENRGKHGE